MKKLVLGAGLSAALLSGVANAAITLGAGGIPVISLTNTTEVYLSGASAPLPFIEGLLTNPAVADASQLCQPGTQIYKYKDNGSGKDQDAYLCVKNLLNPALAASGAKENLLIYKRSLGGSAYGVNPLISGATVGFLKIIGGPAPVGAPVVSGILTTITLPYYTTGTTVNAAANQLVKSDFGVSDVDPIEFQGTNTPVGFLPVTATQVAALTVKPAVSQVFGVAVTTGLRNALQTLQGKVAGSELAANQPSLTSAQIAAIFAGNTASWSTLIPGLPATHVHICRRTNGSGTGAQFAQQFYNYPIPVTVAPQRAAPTSELANPPVFAAESATFASVHQLASAGQVTECLTELNSGTNPLVGTSFGAFNNIYGTKFAVGIQSTDQNAFLTAAATTPGFRFVQVNGVAPTIANVNAGTYKDVYEVTYQYNTAYLGAAAKLPVKNVALEIIKQTGNPVVVQALDTAIANQSFGQAGFQSVPGNVACSTSVFVSKYSRGGKAATPLVKKCP